MRTRPSRSIILDRPILRKPSDPLQQRRQILPVDVLHRQEDRPVGFANVVDAADVAVGDLTRDPHFVVELREPDVVARHRLRQEFQRDRLAEAEVIGAIDLAHAATAEESNDAITIREDGAAREAAGAGLAGGEPAGMRGRGSAPCFRGGTRAERRFVGRTRSRHDTLSVSQPAQRAHAPRRTLS
jgi:hypothetical protein